MYYNNYELANLNANEIKSIYCYLGHHDEGKASDMEISGATAKSLCDRGYLKVVGKSEGFVSVGNDLYRKVSVNVYALNCPADVLWNDYKRSAESMITSKKNMSEHYLGLAKERIAEAEALIKAVR